ncbi:hypothetical protein [Robinsoniella peoriensis]|uniref:hypothetical protein n=1 Tax=Robinsoniella peoriensis TaxID=180332 RepID=UPI000AD935E3|nr:hypothetical protein [Robinsoniella peoriensis]
MMKIVIDGKVILKAELDAWKLKRIKKVIRNLKLDLPFMNDADEMNKLLTDKKMQYSYQDMIRILRRKLKIGEIAMKFAGRISGSRRRHALTIIYIDGITAEKLSEFLDELMLQPKGKYRKINLSACPDHYVLKPDKNGTLEVIETTGIAPVPVQFFITFGDEQGIREPRNKKYSHQSVGIAKLRDGTVIGGVRHQFKNTRAGVKVRLLVEFPAICPKGIIREHEKHLATEFSNWIEWMIDQQNDEL